MTITSFGPANRIARSAETHPLTWRLRDDGEPIWLEEYQAKNGYAAARKALAQMSADDIVQSVRTPASRAVAALASPLALSGA